MKLEPSCKVSQEELVLELAEIEPLLQAPAMDLKPWPNAVVTLKDNRTLFIREATQEDIPQLLKFLKRVMDVEHDFYDIVGARVYSEVLGWHRKRLKDPFVLLGLIDGKLAGLSNGRFWNKDIAISHHTLTFERGERLGWVMYYAKTYYALEIMQAQEWWSTFESYNGWRMAGVEMAQPSYRWPDHQHELGGAPIYYINQKYWNGVIKNFLRTMVGADLSFEVSKDIKKRNEILTVPEELEF
jgi:hypothetical protein